MAQIHEQIATTNRSLDEGRKPAKECGSLLRGLAGNRRRDATMLRDTLAGLIEPMLASAGAYHSRTGCRILGIRHRTIDPCLENPRPDRGGTYTSGERRFSISR